MGPKNARIFRVIAGIFLVSAFVPSAALAYWQFIERPAGAEVKPSPRYNTEKECAVALRKAEAALKKAFPTRYPLVGSCEEFR